jgi:hypothetical protein
MKWLNKMFDETVISHSLWPPYSSNISACDILRGYLKYCDCYTSVHAEEGQRKYTGCSVTYIQRETAFLKMVSLRHVPAITTA